jgi:uncharacterized protein (TIGR03435 family)
MALLLSAMAIAQTDSPPRFGVSSVKPSAADEREKEFRTTPGGRVTITNLTLKDMIVEAWQVRAFQISGAGGWMESLRYDVVAKPDSIPLEGALPLMLRALLSERFGLTLHRETREMPIYALVMAKPGAKRGAGLVDFKEGSCPDFDRTRALAAPEPGKSPTIFCGKFLTGRTWMKGSGVPIISLINTLSGRLGRTIVDETGLTGKYDISLQWTPDEGASAPSLSDGPGAATPDISGAPLFNAIQEQLGPKLLSKKGPVEILMIDQAARPDEN